MSIWDTDSNMTNDYNYDAPSDLGTYDIQDIVINSVLLYIGLCTNIWMLWSLFKTRQAGSRAQFYLIVICIAETLGLILYCSVEISVRVTMTWSAGDAGCKIIKALQEFSSLAYYILVGFNVDNIITVIRGRSTMTVRVVFLVLAILCAVAIGITQAVMYETIEVNSRYILTVCSTDLIPALANLIAAVGIPMVLVCLFGVPSLCLWCARKGALSQSAYKEDGSGTDAKHIGQDIGLALALDLFFVLFLSPLLLFQLFINFVGPYAMPMYVVTSTLATAHSCFNPLIYAVFLCLNRRQKSSPEL